MEIPCKRCGGINRFEQPYIYHAGFSDRCFLYNEAGNLTLVWWCTDPDFEAIMGPLGSSTFSRKAKAAFESRLTEAPFGGKWLFKNPARCVRCGSKILDPMVRTTSYVIYDGSIVLDDWRKGKGLALALKP
jgi:DNA-directed RNA polymerase subunit RPC12/RpoP